MNRLQLSNQLQNQCNNIEIAFAGADMILIVHFHLQQHRGLVQWLALRTRHSWMESQLATLATDTGTTFAKLFQVEGIQTILFKFWAFRVYTLNNLTPIRLFCVKGRFSGLSGIKTDYVWPEIRPLGFKGLNQKVFTSIRWPKSLFCCTLLRKIT